LEIGKQGPVLCHCSTGRRAGEIKKKKGIKVKSEVILKSLHINFVMRSSLEEREIGANSQNICYNGGIGWVGFQS